MSASFSDQLLAGSNGLHSGRLINPSHSSFTTLLDSVVYRNSTRSYILPQLLLHYPIKIHEEAPSAWMPPSALIRALVTGVQVGSHRHLFSRPNLHHFSLFFFLKSPPLSKQNHRRPHYHHFLLSLDHHSPQTTATTSFYPSVLHPFLPEPKPKKHGFTPCCCCIFQGRKEDNNVRSAMGVFKNQRRNSLIACSISCLPFYYG